MINPKSFPFAIGLLGLLIIYTGFDDAYGRFTIVANGIITKSVDTPESNSGWYYTTYELKDETGKTTTFIANGNAIASLPRSMPVGSHIIKKYGELGYMYDGKWITGDNSYLVSLISGCMLIFLNYYLWQRKK